MKLLIVDDNPDITLEFKIGLEAYGYHIDVYNNPLEVLKDFRNGTYDMLLTDIRMPEMSGFELAKIITKIDNKIKICFMTAFIVYYESLLESYPRLRSKCFIQKPISIDRLHNHISKHFKD